MLRGESGGGSTASWSLSSVACTVVAPTLTLASSLGTVARSSSSLRRCSAEPPGRAGVTARGTTVAPSSSLDTATRSSRSSRSRRRCSAELGRGGLNRGGVPGTREVMSGTPSSGCSGSLSVTGGVLSRTLGSESSSSLDGLPRSKDSAPLAAMDLGVLGAHVRVLKKAGGKGALRPLTNCRLASTDEAASESSGTFTLSVSVSLSLSLLSPDRDRSANAATNASGIIHPQHMMSAPTRPPSSSSLPFLRFFCFFFF